MADIAKLKKKAADFEAKKQMDKAIAAYREVLDIFDAGDEEPVDVPLYNRVGDLLQKQGSLPEAVSLWERAADLYAEGGFFNNAIALCNKILRQSPGRAVVYYKLGKISAAKGFKADARDNFLEYAGRMQKAGNLDEAFRALMEFADLVPDQYDVRLMLADQLVKAERGAEAIEQLQILYGIHVGDGRQDDADEVASKMREIDPAVEPRAEGASRARADDSLVFLDLDPSTGPSGGRKTRKSTMMPKATPADVKRVTKAVEGLEIIDIGIEDGPAAPPLAPPPPRPSQPLEMLLEPTSLEEDDNAPSGGLAGLEATSFDDIGLETTSLGFEATSLEVESTSAADDLPMLDVGGDAPSGGDLPMLEMESTDLGGDIPMLDMEGTDLGGGDLPMLDMGSDDAPSALPAADEDSFGMLDVEMPAAELPAASAPSRPAAASLSGLPMMDMDEDEVVVAPRRTSMILAVSVGALREKVSREPENWGLRREFAEALLDDGAREEGVAELEASLAGFEGRGDLDTAAAIADEIVRLSPDSIRFLQKRVEFAFRADDRRRLAEAYVDLGDALLRDKQPDKARAVFQRVLDIRADDLRASAAIEAIDAELAALPPDAPVRRRTSRMMTPLAGTSVDAPTPPAGTPAPASAKGSDDDDFVSLGDWLREDEGPKNTRMVVAEEAPSGDEQADFSDMLKKFKQGVSENVEEEDHEAHYDLGVAYKEMGLLDEAIAEFQKAMRGTSNRVRTLEALGLCFVEKQQLPVAATILQRALAEPGINDEALVGVLYQLGSVSEQLERFADAKKYYERVFAVDIQFSDVGERLNSVESRL